MKAKPPVSIIILNLNGLADTLECLFSLKKTNYPNFEVLVVDNGSKVNEAKLIKKKFGDFVLTFRLRKNRGFAGGNNWALKKTKGKYVVLLNNDTIVEKNWLEPLVRIMEKEKWVAVVQPKIHWMRKRSYFDYAGAAGGFIDRFGYPFTQGRIFEVLEKDRGQYDSLKEIFWASGAAMMIRRSVIEEVGGLFDSTFFNYMEEIDFCWRVWNAGYKAVIVPDSLIYHKVAASAKKNFLLKRYWEHRNNLLLLAKNLPKEKLFVILSLRILFELATYFYYLGTGKIRFVVALFLAHLDFLRLLPSTFKEREKAIQVKETNLPIYQGSIIVDYFIKGKRRFRQLNWLKATGERTNPKVGYLLPTFAQHQKTYQFCLSYVTGKRVLDAGCGVGRGTFLLSRKAKEIVGIDSDLRSINYAKANYKRENLFFEAIDILDFESKRPFDVVISLQVIEHMKKVRPYLLKILKLVKKGGVVIFSTPNKSTQSYNENPYHFREYSATQFEKLLAKYFKKLTLYGLRGDEYVRSYEDARKRQILKIMNGLDKFHLRRFLPRKVKILLFEFFIPIVRKRIIEKGLPILEKNYFISENTKGAIDLIAVCRN